MHVGVPKKTARTGYYHRLKVGEETSERTACMHRGPVQVKARATSRIKSYMWRLKTGLAFLCSSKFAWNLCGLERIPFQSFGSFLGFLIERTFILYMAMFESGVGRAEEASLLLPFVVGFGLGRRDLSVVSTHSPALDNSNISRML